ncbi:hypothetical protein AOL_s00080g92 [Orbilia oligospora ATCC 24927]|uniref:Uncharacterized protein n=1 Tax=Arthrobotrys oligospora (strain ATCC 24927 / CBS 115.81 / DSM 1491) TaxID=756982 RepID=G1XE57_ARTOA|nr:hypothetical protein AOL_s00080g92 [Orbilia oligospora ATCC 24927]EGX48463.1 hypothetical protein AOL_s00080g92 [Orbilia oligospora ATCC 24927]
MGKKREEAELRLRSVNAPRTTGTVIVAKPWNDLTFIARSLSWTSVEHAFKTLLALDALRATAMRSASN